MGQYYIPAILDKRDKPIKWFTNNRFYMGAKMMDHAYFDSALCNAVEQYLVDNPQRLVWAGDYAKSTPNRPNLYTMIDKLRHPSVLDDVRFIRIMEELFTTDCCDPVKPGYFVINHSNKQYYSRDSVKDIMRVEEKRYAGASFLYDIPNYSINPLPLLTRESDEIAGGDYRGSDKKHLIGSWARDVIELSYNVPDEYELIFPVFVEDLKL